jgi:hypothetical protein
MLLRTSTSNRRGWRRTAAYDRRNRSRPVPGPRRRRDGRPRPVLRQAKQQRASRRPGARSVSRAAALSKRPSAHDSIRALRGAIVSARDAALLLSPNAEARRSVPPRSSTDHAGDDGYCCRNLKRRLSPVGGRRAVALRSGPALRPRCARSQSSRPALTCIIGARRAWIVPMISSTSIP